MSLKQTSFQPPPGKFDLILKDLDPVSRPRQLLYSVLSAVFLCKHWLHKLMTVSSVKVFKKGKFSHWMFLHLPLMAPTMFWSKPFRLSLSPRFLLPFGSELARVASSKKAHTWKHTNTGLEHSYLSNWT